MSRCEEVVGTVQPRIFLNDFRFEIASAFGLAMSVQADSSAPLALRLRSGLKVICARNNDGIFYFQFSICDFQLGV
jgi:hypothetical protein